MIQLDFSELAFSTILPSLILLFGALCLLLINVFARVFSQALQGLNVALSAIFLGFSIIFSCNLSVGDAFFGFIHISGISILSQIAMELCSLIFIVLFLGSKVKTDDISARVGEFYPLYLLMIAGFDLMVSSTHLLVILLGLEIGSLSLCALIALNGRSKGLEASIKYFVLSILASVFFILGVLCLYLAGASFDMIHIQDVLHSKGYISIWGVLLGFVFMVAALGFKTSIVPFHSYMPDVYEGSNAIVAGVFSIVPKIAAFAVALLVFETFLQSGIVLIEQILYVLVVLTITIPNIAALVQQDMKRMLAFSSISHSGFVLACILIDTQVSISSLYLYWFLFMFSNIGAFGLLWFAQNKQESWKQDFEYPISRFNGLLASAPLYAVFSGIFLLSLAGIPPFGLFWGKMLVITSAFGSDYIYLAVIMAINSAIAVFYYLKPVIAMFVMPPNAEKPKSFLQNATPFGKILIGAMALLCCISIFMIQFLLYFIGKYVIGAY